MAAPNPVDGAARPLPADINDEAMDVDPRAMEMVKTALMYSRTTTADLLRTVGRKPGEVPTQGDMQHLGELFTNRLILSAETALTARQVEADDELIYLIRPFASMGKNFGKNVVISFIKRKYQYIYYGYVLYKRNILCFYCLIYLLRLFFCIHRGRILARILH